MSWRRATCAAVWVLAQACSGGGSTNPCTQCPAIAGSYTVLLDTTGGTLSSGCSSLGIGPPAGPLVLTQSAAILGGSYAGFGLAGTLYDSYDLSVSGLAGDGGSTNSLSIHATYVPSLGDAGAQLRGDVSAQYEGTQAGQTTTCSEYLPFTAAP